MNSSFSFHRVALDLLIGARLSLASNPNTFLEDSFPVVVVHHPVLDPTGVVIASVRGLRTGPTRRSGHFPKVDSHAPILSCPTV
jgi:hypothetical protein